jgi:hypothetical protein
MKCKQLCPQTLCLLCIDTFEGQPHLTDHPDNWKNNISQFCIKIKIKTITSVACFDSMCAGLLCGGRKLISAVRVSETCLCLNNEKWNVIPLVALSFLCIDQSNGRESIVNDLLDRKFISNFVNKTHPANGVHANNINE